MEQLLWYSYIDSHLNDSKCQCHSQWKNNGGSEYAHSVKNLRGIRRGKNVPSAIPEGVNWPTLYRGSRGPWPRRGFMTDEDGGAITTEQWNSRKFVGIEGKPVDGSKSPFPTLPWDSLVAFAGIEPDNCISHRQHYALDPLPLLRQVVGYS